MPTRVTIPDVALEEAIAGSTRRPSRCPTGDATSDAEEPDRCQRARRPHPRSRSPTTSIDELPAPARRVPRCSTSAPTSCRRWTRSRACVEKCRALLFPGFVGAGVARCRAPSCASWCASGSTSCARPLRRQVYRALHHKPPADRAARADLDCRDCAGERRRHHRALHRAAAGAARAGRRRRAPPTTAIRPRPAPTRSSSVTRAVRDHDLPARPRAAARGRGIDPAHDDRARAREDRHRHPPGRDHRRVVLHRPRHRRRDRRDQPRSATASASTRA